MSYKIELQLALPFSSPKNHNVDLEAEEMINELEKNKQD